MSNALIPFDVLRRDVSAVIRWAGSVARELRKHNISLAGKQSGSAQTDALTLADLTVQDLVLSALRDLHPFFRTCRIEAEESNGDLESFSESSSLTIALDPIDGTKVFRDRTGNGWCVMLHIRNTSTVLASLVFAPEMGQQGTWVYVDGDGVRVGADDTTRSAGEVVSSLPVVKYQQDRWQRNIYLIGFQKHDPDSARKVSELGLKGYAPDDMPGSIYPLIASGEFEGSLIHTPNVYDFPVSLHIVRQLGGDAVWVHNGEPVHFRETWLDERAGMLRLPGIVACAIDADVRQKLVDLARDWNPIRYRD